MTKTFKLASGVLAGTLFLTGVSNVSALDITKANSVSEITVKTENDNIKAFLLTEDEKDYLEVTALNDAKNISVRVSVKNNQTFIFKHSELKKGESVKFELDVAEKVQEVSKKKSLPKTDVVREKLTLLGKVKGFELSAIISYDVEKEMTDSKAEVEKPKTEAEKLEEVKKDWKTTETAEEMKATEDAVSDAWEKAAKEAEKLETVKKDWKTTETAEEMKSKEDAISDEWEKVAKEAERTTPAVVENKEEAKVNEGNSTSTFRSVEALQPSVEVKPEETVVKEEVKEVEIPKMDTLETKEVAKATEDAHSDAWEKAAKEANVANKIIELSQGLSVVSNEAREKELLNAVNKYRQEKGLPVLVINRLIDKGTMLRATEFMTEIKKGVEGYSLHKRPDKSDWFTAFSGLGSVHSEILAYSRNGVEGLMNFWKNSPSHNAAILDRDIKTVSIKVIEVNGEFYGVQIFSK